MSSLSLVVDTREREVAAILERLCRDYNNANAGSKTFEPVQFTVESLDVGDFVLRRPVDPNDGSSTCAWIFERKSLADLAASIVDGRHRSQTPRLCSAMQTDRAIVELLCEVPPSKRDFLNPCCNSNPYPGTRISASALRGAIYNNDVRDGIRMHIVSSQTETAYHLLSRLVYGRRWPEKVVSTSPVPSIPLSDTAIHQQQVSLTPTPFEVDALNIVAHKKRKNCNATSQTCFADMLNAMEGVGLKRALTIAKHFGSMSELIKALQPVHELTTTYNNGSCESGNDGGIDEREVKRRCSGVFSGVDGVGPSTAMNIYRGVYGLN